MSAADPDAPARSSPVRVWDVWIRLFHWSLVVAVALQFYSGLTGELFFDWHRLVGEIVLALVLFRLLWGLVGSRNARLTAPLRNPRDALAHLAALARREAPPEAGHNAAGSFAVLALLALLAVQALTGLFIADEDEFVEGAFYGRVSGALSDTLYDVHQANATLLWVLVLVHVAMTFVYLLWARRNLIGAMITGRARWPASRRPPAPGLASPWLGLGLALLVAAALGWLLGWFGR